MVAVPQVLVEMAKRTWQKGAVDSDILLWAIFYLWFFLITW